MIRFISYYRGLYFFLGFYNMSKYAALNALFFSPSVWGRGVGMVTSMESYIFRIYSSSHLRFHLISRYRKQQEIIPVYRRTSEFCPEQGQASLLWRSHVACSFQYPVLHKNLCCSDFSFELVITSAWFLHPLTS